MNTAVEFTIDSSFDFGALMADGLDRGFHISPDELNVFIASYSNRKIYQFKLATAGDLSSAYLFGSSRLLATSERCQHITMSPDGTKLFSTLGGNKVNEYTLATANDITTLGSVDYTLTTTISSIYGITFSPDGTQLLVNGVITGGSRLEKYTLSVGFDLSTAVFVANQDFISSQFSTGQTIMPDGITIIGQDFYTYRMSGKYNLPVTQLSPNTIAASSRYLLYIYPYLYGKESTVERDQNRMYKILAI